jgi:hypothetical protein
VSEQYAANSYAGVMRPAVRSEHGGAQCGWEARPAKFAIHFVESKGSFAHDRADDGVPEVRDLGAQPAPCNRRGQVITTPTNKETEIDSDSLFIAPAHLTAKALQVNHLIGTAAVVVAIFHSPGVGPRLGDLSLSALSALQELRAAIDALECDITHPYPRPGDKLGLWQISHSTVTCSEAD